MCRAHPVFTLLLLMTACEVKEDAITGTCVWDAAEDLPDWCVNLWDGETDCAEGEGGEPATWSEGGSCESLGFPYPCTADLPSSTWMALEEDCLTD